MHMERGSYFDNTNFLPPMKADYTRLFGRMYAAVGAAGPSRVNSNPSQFKTICSAFSLARAEIASCFLLEPWLARLDSICEISVQTESISGLSIWPHTLLRHILLWCASV